MARRLAAVFALRDLILAGESFRAAVAERFGAGVRETEAISYLRANGPMTPAQLAAALHLTNGTITNLLNRLERADLAYRTLHPTDRRRTLVQLTEHAHVLADATRDWMDQSLDALAGTSDLGTARDVLDVLATELRTRSAEIAATPCPSARPPQVARENTLVTDANGSRPPALHREP